MASERLGGRSRGVLTLGLVLAAIFVALWWTMRVPNVQDGASGADWDRGTGFTAFALSERPEVPSIEGTTINGQQLALADLRGDVVVLNVWGSWCSPCRAEAPDLAAVAEAMRPRGVRFVGIDVRDNPAAARAFVRNYDIPYPSFDDADGRVLAAFVGLIPISAVPSTLVVDQSGGVAARVVGQVSASTLRGVIRDLLDEAAGKSGESS